MNRMIVSVKGKKFRKFKKGFIRWVFPILLIFAVIHVLKTFMLWKEYDLTTTYLTLQKWQLIEDERPRAAYFEFTESGHVKYSSTLSNASGSWTFRDRTLWWLWPYNKYGFQIHFNVYDGDDSFGYYAWVSSSSVSITSFDVKRELIPAGIE